MVIENKNEILPEDVIFTPRQSMAALLNSEKSLRLYTYEIIRFFLEKYNHNILKVAEVLEIGKSTIYRLLKEMEENEQK